MNRKEYNQIRTEIYNLSLFVAELERLDGSFPILSEEARNIINEKSKILEKELEKIRSGK